MIRHSARQVARTIIVGLAMGAAYGAALCGIVELLARICVRMGW